MLSTVSAPKGALGDTSGTSTVKGSDATINFEVSGARIHYSGKVDKEGKEMEGTIDYAGQPHWNFLGDKEINFLDVIVMVRRGLRYPWLHPTSRCFRHRQLLPT